MSVCKKDFDGTGCMYFLIKDERFLEIYNEILEKPSNNIKKELNSEPVHNKKYLKAGKEKSTQKKAFNIFAHE